MTAETLTQKEQEAIARSLRHKELVMDVTGQIRAGRFNGVPDELARRNYHFVRCGRKDDPRAQQKCRDLCDLGYDLAPPSVRAVGFEKDGENNLIVGAPPEVYHNLKEAKWYKYAQRRDRLKSSDIANIEARLKDGLRNTEVNFVAHLGTGSADDMKVEMERVTKAISTQGNARKR